MYHDSSQRALRARSCRCEKRDGDQPYGDLREGTCLTCGHQVGGRPILIRPKGLGLTDSRTTYPKATRKYPPLA